MTVDIGYLTKDGLQTRVALDERTVADYAQAMRDGDTFPPVKVFEDRAGVMWLADGFHRVEAATRAGRTDIEADSVPGEFIDALRYALGCNAHHGKRVTNEDKQNAMQMAWDNRQALFGGEPSAGLLADTCGVHRNTAAAFVAERHESSQIDSIQLAQNVQVASATNLPTRPVRRVIGRDNRVRPVPAAPVRPQRPVVAPEHVVPTDRWGVEIPVPMQGAFADKEILRDVMNDISHARCLIRRNGPEMAAVRQDALVMLDNAYDYVSAAIPFCVCRMCQGHGCMACHNRGWQTEEEYDRNPQEFKA